MANQAKPFLSTLKTILGWLGSDDGNSDNRANTGQLELDLGLSMAIFRMYSFQNHTDPPCWVCRKWASPWPLYGGITLLCIDIFFLICMFLKPKVLNMY